MAWLVRRIHRRVHFKGGEAIQHHSGNNAAGKSEPPARLFIPAPNFRAGSMPTASLSGVPWEQRASLPQPPQESHHRAKQTWPAATHFVVCTLPHYRTRLESKISRTSTPEVEPRHPPRLSVCLVFAWSSRVVPAYCTLLLFTLLFPSVTYPVPLFSPVSIYLETL